MSSPHNALTRQGFLLNNQVMTEFENLEQKIAQLVAQHKLIKDDNRDLRLRVQALDAENKRLTEKVEAARARVEALIERLPAED